MCTKMNSPCNHGVPNAAPALAWKHGLAAAAEAAADLVTKVRLCTRDFEAEFRYRKPYTKSALPAAIATYCLPPTA